MGDASRFWDRMARRYSRQPVADEAAYQKKIEVTRKYLTPDSEVLELGCGTGSTALVHAPAVKHICATDFSKNMIAIAESKREAAGISNVRFECATIDDVAAADDQFDAVLALSVLHLMDDWRGAVLKAHALLNPGGVFVTSTACLGDSMKWLGYILRLGRFTGLIPHVEVFTTTELEQGLRDAGFGIDYQWQPGRNKAVFIVARKH